MPRPLASQKAFTLIEVLMAATVLVVSFTAVIQAVTAGADMIDTARKQQIAQQIIDGEIAGMRLRPWGGSTPAAGDISYPAGTHTIIIDSDGVAQGPSGANYHRKRFAVTNFSIVTTDDNTILLNSAKGFTVAQTVTDIRPDFREFTYTVSWSGMSGRAHSRTGVAFIGKNGLHLSYQK